MQCVGRLILLITGKKRFVIGRMSKKEVAVCVEDWDERLNMLTSG
jgi:hypothetical protein